jgi:Xaa-Pro aminopeptidase
MSNYDRLRAAMKDAGVGALLVSDPVSVAWLTGFSGSFARVVIDDRSGVFVTDSRYALQAREQVTGLPVESFGSPTNGEDFLAAQIRKLGIQRLGFEAGTTTYAQWKLWEEKLATQLVPAPDLFGKLRMVKSEDEIERVRKACHIADAAFAHIQRMIQPGVAEYDLALDLEFFIRRQGADVAFPSIVVSGERSARPHGTPSEKKLESGDFVTFDFGARVDGYNSDMTRTIVVGRATDRHKKVYEAVLDAQIESLHAMRPGALARDIDKLSREILAQSDLAQYFGHGLGHGLGSIVHDSGRMNASSDDILAAGQIWTVEPGVYIPGFGGVRIEDDVVITADGIEILTHSPKELLELPV